MKCHINCAVIGEGNLLLCCLRDLLDAGIEVKVAFTNTACVSELCQNNGITYYSRNANLHDILQKHNIDYLFSISNPQILKEDVLRLPKKLTINYHDSPLPAYAGIHATSWAIMNGEQKHGISWHVVETGIDTGDILQSETVDIHEEDSALTLNLNCQEAAKRAFERLVGDITHDKLSRKKQSQIGRTYFGLNAIPTNAGVLNFNDSAENIYNMARGLEFGNHENALGSPKIQSCKGVFYLVTNASISEDRQSSNAKPGVILDIIDDTLEVSTKSNSLLLSLANIDGSHIQRSLFQKCGFVVSESLKSDFQIDTDDLVPMKRKESFWRKKMAVYEPTVFYRQRMNVVAGILDVSTDINVKTMTFSLPHMKSNTIHDCEETFLYAYFVAFLARINCTSDVHIGLTVDKTRVTPECWSLYSDITPAIFEVDLNSDIDKILKDCSTKCQLYADSRTFLVDMFYRYPELRGQKRIPHHNIILGRKRDSVENNGLIASVLHDSNILLLFDEDDSLVELLYHERPAEDLSHIVDVLRHFPTFMKAISESKPSAKLQEISLMQESELQQFYNISDPLYNENDEDESLNGLVQRQCMLTPLSIALKTTAYVFTYKKMSEEINQMQKILSPTIHRSAGPKEIIAIHLPNSIAYIVSLLAIVGCKFAFLPIPIDMPPERVIFTLKDADVKKMIIKKENAAKCDLNGLSASMRVVFKHIIANEEIVMLDFNKEENGRRKNPNIESDSGKENQPRNQTDEDFSYIMYTSGSTGRPKGVKVKESSVINLARAQINVWDLGPGDVIAQFASIGFDASVSEIFTSILSGASLAVLGQNERLGSDFVTAMNKMKVTAITLPPSALNIYSPDDLPSLQKVVTAGEACTLNTAMKWTSVEDVRFFNAYGPTEGTVCATCHEYVPGTKYEDVNRELPIGKAIDGVQVYLFDDFMNPVPPDVVGEIYIGGRGLAHGYIGHAQHYTPERFVQNPLTNKPSLLYKTGDHAFQDPEGNITFIGRLDDQVKIRGHRVDLSEIEQVLIQHMKIEMAVVVVHKCSSTKDLSIAAFVAPTFIYISELREYLAKVLPKYMIPTYITKLEVSDFPKTLNGKVNRKVLETDESIHENMSNNGNSHLNETQLLVAKHWCTVFKFDESFIYSLHRQSSFSELGGNSLQLVLLLRLIEDDLKIHFSFTDLGIADTIEEFAEVIQRRKDMKHKHEHNNTKSKEELRELIFHDSELDNNFFPNPERRRSVQFTSDSTVLVRKHTNIKRPRNVLLSGVTGFVGAFLLSELLEQTDAHICCMVRETSEARGMGRVVDNMRKYKLWKFEYATRIAIVISDLTQKKMGIAPDIYKSLCNAIDVVFMNAAAMNFNTPYEDHRVANVEGTKEFIKFASTGVRKYLFTTSSLSVFLFPQLPPESTQPPTSRRICTEAEFLDDPLLIEGGYGQSKWASERLVMQALDFLPGGAIFRPARVSGRSSDGVGPKNDLFASILYGMKRLGCYPDMDFPFDLTPVDFCAKSMIEITVKVCNSSLEKPEKVYHIFNKDTFPFNHLFKGMGLRSCSLSEWRQELRNASADNKELIPLTPFFMSVFWDKAPFWPVFDTSNTDNNISDDTKQLMKPSKVLLKTYKKFFKL